MDYLQAIAEQSASILLNGTEHEVRRANLGLHYRLSVIADQWQEARGNRDYRLSVALTFRYVALATGLDIEEIRQAGLLEVMLSFTLLMRLNAPQDDLPFMRVRRRGKRLEKAYDYENRSLADWVARLARHYSWTAGYVLNELTPEEAICYMQEAMLQDWEEKEFIYRLSEVAYKVEGKGKSARAKYVPLTKPGWMADKMPKVRVPKTWLPQGNIIEAGDVGRPAGNA